MMDNSLIISSLDCLLRRAKDLKGVEISLKSTKLIILQIVSYGNPPLMKPPLTPSQSGHIKEMVVPQRDANSQSMSTFTLRL